MADTRTAQVAAAAGVAAGTGAAQLGLGYGLSVVVWPASIATSDSVWLSSLGWATWIAASSTVLGAVTANWLRSTTSPSESGSARSTGSSAGSSAGGPGAAGGPAVAERRSGGPWRLALAVAAALGAMLTVVLIAVPARTAVRADNFAPETIAAGYAIVGVLIGLFIAYWAVVSRPVAANLIVTAGWLWALAVAAVVHGLIRHLPTSGTYLGGWQLTGPGYRYGTIYWPGALLTLVAALVIGALAVWPAVRRGDHGVGAATSGAVGPLLMAVAFFVLAPQLTGALGELESAYLVAPYAVLTGLAGSASVVALGQRSAARRATRTPSSPPPPPDAVAVPVGAAPHRGWLQRKPRAKKDSAPSDVSTSERPATAKGRARLPKARSAADPSQPAQSSPAPRSSAGQSSGGSSPSGGLPPAVDPWPSAGATPASTPATGRSAADGTGSDRPAAGRPNGPTASGSASVAPSPAQRSTRSTVKAPPANPTVAMINPSSAGATRSPGADPSPGRATAAASANSAAGQSASAAAASTPAKTATAPAKKPPAQGAPGDNGPARGAPAKSTSVQGASGKSASAQATPSKSASGQTSSAKPAAARNTSKRPSVARVEAPDTTPSSAAPRNPARSQGTPAASLTPDSADQAADRPAAASPLWVDDSEAASGSTPGNDGIKGRFRRFGRRPPSDN